MKAMRYLLDWRDSTAKVSVSGYPAIELREASILSVNCLVVRIVIGLICVGTALGSNIGDTYQQVLAEKGNPRSQIEAGSVRMLTYPDAVIKLKDDVVVSIKLVATEPSNGPAAAPDSSTPPTVESRTAELKAQLEDAVSKVERIVNQEVPSQPRTPDMKLWRFYFHDGATRPNFNLVDVRQTRETPYDSHEFITWAGHEDLVWVGSQCEFNSMTKFFYLDRSLPKKKLTESEMLEINRLYRVIARCEQLLTQLGYKGKMP